MRSYRALVIIPLLVSGCASTQLNHNALDLASTVDSLVSRQVLHNLSKFIDEPSAIPTQVNISSGSATTTNSLTASFANPLGSTSTLAHTVASAASTTVTDAKTTARAAKTLTPAATDTWTQTWGLSTITDPDQMRRVRALYRFATGTSGNFEDVEFKRECARKVPDKFVASRPGPNGLATGALLPDITALKVEPYCPNVQAEYPLVKKTVTDADKKTYFVNDPAFLVQPGCIFCARKQPPDPNVPDSSLELNSALKNDWLNWEPRLGGRARLAHTSSEVALGEYGNYRLFATDSEAYNQFMMFILEATAQSSGIAGGGGGKSNNTNGPLIIVPGGGG
jgi:hypothetical protein